MRQHDHTCRFQLTKHIQSSEQRVTIDMTEEMYACSIWVEIPPMHNDASRLDSRTGTQVKQTQACSDTSPDITPPNAQTALIGLGHRGLRRCRRLWRRLRCRLRGGLGGGCLERREQFPRQSQTRGQGLESQAHWRDSRASPKMAQAGRHYRAQASKANAEYTERVDKADATLEVNKVARKAAHTSMITDAQV